MPFSLGLSSQSNEKKENNGVVAQDYIQSIVRAIHRDFHQPPCHQTIKILCMHVHVNVFHLFVITWVNYQLCCLNPVYNHKDSCVLSDCKATHLNNNYLNSRTLAV